MQQFGEHLDEEILFPFCFRRADQIKALYWSGDGDILPYKVVQRESSMAKDRIGASIAGASELSLAHKGATNRTTAHSQRKVQGFIPIKSRDFA